MRFHNSILCKIYNIFGGKSMPSLTAKSIWEQVLPE
jgi:hypothetical protein